MISKTTQQTSHRPQQPGKARLVQLTALRPVLYEVLNIIT